MARLIGGIVDVSYLDSMKISIWLKISGFLLKWAPIMRTISNIGWTVFLFYLNCEILLLRNNWCYFQISDYSISAVKNCIEYSLHYDNGNYLDSSNWF